MGMCRCAYRGYWGDLKELKSVLGLSAPPMRLSDLRRVNFTGNATKAASPQEKCELSTPPTEESDRILQCPPDLSRLAFWLWMMTRKSVLRFRRWFPLWVMRRKWRQTARRPWKNSLPGIS